MGLDSPIQNKFPDFGTAAIVPFELLLADRLIFKFVGDVEGRVVVNGIVVSLDGPRPDSPVVVTEHDQKRKKMEGLRAGVFGRCMLITKASVTTFGVTSDDISQAHCETLGGLE